MKEIILYWGIDADLILVPNFIAEQLIFNAEVFVNWLNDFVILDENQRAKIIKSEFQPSKEDRKLPRINF